MSGYIGSKAAVVSNGAERKKTYSITGTTTSLTGLSYTVNQVHVFHNGVRLVDGTDFTATNGNSITLTNAAQSGDEVVVISYAGYQVSDSVSASQGGTFNSSIDVNADGATVLTVDRATSDGTIIDVQKNGTTVGSIASQFGTGLKIDTQGTLQLESGSNNRYLYLDFDDATPTFYPSPDDTLSIGRYNRRFKDLYLSGGVYLGGTASANYMEDYEEGTWTPVLTNYSGTYGSQVGTYTKVGNLVSFSFYLETGTAAGAGNITVGGLPFASGLGSNRYHAYQGWGNGWDSNGAVQYILGPGATYLNMYNVVTSGGVTQTTVADIGDSANIIISGTYTTDA